MTTCFIRPQQHMHREIKVEQARTQWWEPPSYVMGAPWARVVTNTPTRLHMFTEIAKELGAEQRG